jgi:hypothetical protein
MEQGTFKLGITTWDEEKELFGTDIGTSDNETLTATAWGNTEASSVFNAFILMRMLEKRQKMRT